MGMNLLNLLSMLLMLSSDSFAEPTYPVNTISGGTVVAELRTVPGGGNQVKILSGEEPFVGSSKEALQRWDLQPGQSGAAIVVVHFRQPNIYYLGSSEEEVRCAGIDPSLPCPSRIVGPAYPASGQGQGSVILRVEIGADGGVLNVQTLKGMGSYTSVSVEAVRQWKFSPARNARGANETSHAYAVFVYSFPVTGQKRK